MNQKYSSRKSLLADCPNCRQSSLVLLKSASGRKSQDMLACKRCKLGMFVEELKKKLFTV